MRVSAIRISNVLGIAELEIKPGNLTTITGQNATGKTSIIEAIKAALGGGHDASLVRQGAEFGEVVILLDDGTEIRRRIGEDRSPPTVKHPQFGKVGRPQQYLDRLVDALSFNPVSFLTAPTDKRAQWLLELLAVEVDLDEISQAAGVELLKHEVRPNGLDTLEVARKKVYDLRTGVNRIADEKKKTVATLEAGLPDNGDDPAEELREASERLKKLSSLYAQKAQVLKEKLLGHLELSRNVIQERIDTLKDELKTTEQDLREENEKLVVGLEQEFDPQIDAAKEDVARLGEVVRTAERAKETRRMIEQFKAEARDAEKQSKRLSEGLKNLEELKARMLTSLPVRGLEVRDGQVFKDGIPFERTNRAKQVAVALQVAKLRAGDLGLVCVDNLECLDADTFAAFEKAAVKSGLQLVVTRVTEGPLDIQTTNNDKGA